MRASRLQRVAGKNTWTDGPFAESKELISGYTILKADSKQEAVEWATRYSGYGVTRLEMAFDRN